jgi:hypothetical protein
VVLVATIATLVLAVLSYAAFKLRGRRKPQAAAARPVYFRRVRLDEPAEAPREPLRP